MFIILHKFVGHIRDKPNRSHLYLCIRNVIQLLNRECSMSLFVFRSLSVVRFSVHILCNIPVELNPFPAETLFGRRRADLPV